MLAVFAANGLLALQPLVLGGAADAALFCWRSLVGTAIFDPGREAVYRWVAYAIIAGSAISGLPVWD